MNSEDSLKALLASTGGDTVKLFDLSLEPRDPCILSYTPSPGFQVNSVKWNHTNLVVASAGDDKKISLWRKNGQSLGTVPMGGADGADNIEIHLFRRQWPSCTNMGFAAEALHQMVERSY